MTSTYQNCENTKKKIKKIDMNLKNQKGQEEKWIENYHLPLIYYSILNYKIRLDRGYDSVNDIT